MKVLITGATGMLGRDLVATLSGEYSIVGVSRHRPVLEELEWVEADSAVPGAFFSVAKQVRPAVIINAAAMTLVDQCERESAMAMRINRDAVDELTEYCEGYGAKLVHISTDAIFDGKKIGSYREEDVPHPINVYGSSKRGGEVSALRSSRALVLRTNIFGWRDNGPPGLAEWILHELRAGSRLTTFADVVFSPVSSWLLSYIIRDCIRANLTGLYHAGGSESISKHEFALKIAEAAGLPTRLLDPISIDQKGLIAARPKNLAMDSSKLARALKRSLPDVEASVAAWLASGPDNFSESSHE